MEPSRSREVEHPARVQIQLVALVQPPHNHSALRPAAERPRHHVELEGVPPSVWEPRLRVASVRLEPLGSGEHFPTSLFDVEEQQLATEPLRGVEVEPADDLAHEVDFWLHIGFVLLESVEDCSYVGV